MTERIPNNEEPFYDPVVQFVVNGIKLSLSQNKMSREHAEELIKSWYPDCEIVLDESPPGML